MSLEPLLRRHLLELAYAYIKAKPKKNGKPYGLSSVGHYARGSGPFFEQLEKQELAFKRLGKRADIKGSFTIRVYDDIVSWFKANWPPGAEFPSLADLTQERTHDGKQAENGPETPGEKEQGRPAAGSTGDLLARLRRTVG